MAHFNFELKRSTYLSLLGRLKETLMNKDFSTSFDIAKQCKVLCEEIIANCSIPELKPQFVADQKKLVAIIAKLEKGEDPLAKKETIKETNGKDNEKVKDEFFSKDYPTTTLEDVYGLNEVKEEIRLKIIEPMKDLDFYLKYNDDVGCQILLYGPPGCGKSFVAEAIAGELKCSYAFINAADILDKYVGEAPKKIQQIFKEASKYDNCLIFFDELDSLFASRESDESSHTKDVLTTLLTCLSGFKTNDKKSLRVVIGATNRPWALDSALLRGKRFDTQIYVGLPDYDARYFLIKRQFKNKDHLLTNTDVSLEDLTKRFEGYSGADITAMLSKIKQKAYKRALENKDAENPILLEDVDDVFKNYINSISTEDLGLFEEYRKGII